MKKLRQLNCSQLHKFNYIVNINTSITRMYCVYLDVTSFLRYHNFNNNEDINTYVYL